MKLYRECDRCNGTQRVTGKYTATQPCPDCSGRGFVLFEVPADVEALTKDLLFDGNYYSRTEVATKIAAFCDRREAEKDDEIRLLTEDQGAWNRRYIDLQTRYTEGCAENETLREAVLKCQGILKEYYPVFRHVNDEWQQLNEEIDNLVNDTGPGVSGSL